MLTNPKVDWQGVHQDSRSSLPPVSRSIKATWPKGLPEVDYKLTKARVLNVPLHAALATGLPDGIVERLRERVTSNASAYAMAPPLR
jgi:hypothetical protein